MGAPEEGQEGLVEILCKGEPQLSFVQEVKSNSLFYLFNVIVLMKLSYKYKQDDNAKSVSDVDKDAQTNRDMNVVAKFSDNEDDILGLSSDGLNLIYDYDFDQCNSITLRVVIIVQ